MTGFELRTPGVKSVNSAIVRQKEAIHLLQAEWTVLNAPQRLESLAHKYLPDLAPPKPQQVARIQDIPHIFSPKENP